MMAARVRLVLLELTMIAARPGRAQELRSVPLSGLAKAQPYLSSTQAGLLVPSASQSQALFAHSLMRRKLLT
jgi:hypothetical protein